MGGMARTPFVRTITAIEITGRPELRCLWIPGHDVPADCARRAGLAAGGQASPLGYWLFEEGTEPAPSASGGLQLVVTAPGAAVPQRAARPRPAPAGPAARRLRTQTVKFKARSADQGELVLTIGPGSAHVEATESTWEALAAPVTLAVCQVWRFQTIDADLDRLTRDAFENLPYANAPGLASLAESRRLADLGMRVRATIVDLIYFEKPLTDPFAYFDARRSARFYRRLADRFALDDWCESIDHRAEVVEATFETITEKLYHLKSHAQDVVLAVVIVVILTIDIAMHIWELFV
jgi:hypothetical protein